MHDSLLKCAISFQKIANQNVKILPAGTILYHGTIAPFAAQIKQDGFLHGRAWSHEQQGNKTGGGTMDEQGLIWFSPDRTIGADFANGAEIGVDQAKRLGFEDGVVDKGTVFTVKLSRPYKLIDRYEYELTEDDAAKLIPINKAQHYKRIKPGMKASSAVYALFESSGIRDTWKTVLKILGYDGIVYAGAQYGLADDEIPISSFNDMQMSEEAKKNSIESLRKWEEDRKKWIKEREERYEEKAKKKESPTTTASNLIYCAELFKFAAISDVLSALGASDEIKQFVLSQPKDRMNYYVTVLERSKKENKDIKSINELEAAVNELLQSADKADIMAVAYGFGNNEINTSHGQWAIDNLKRLRKNNPVFDPIKFPKMYPSWNNFIKWLGGNELLGAGGGLPADLQFSRQSFLDWWYNDDNIVDNITNMSIEQVAQAVHNWHEVQAQMGEGLKYKEGSENIVYGPKWHNKAFNGWTIRKITTENDLKAEGNKMNHCVGGYCEEVKLGKSIIYSLRDSKNEPHVTLEGNPEYSYSREPEGWSAHPDHPGYDPNAGKLKKELTNINFSQIYGSSNSDPKKEYKEMIKEWFQSLIKDKKQISIGEDEDINARIYEAARDAKYNRREFSENLEKAISGGQGDYGIPGSAEGFVFKDAYENILMGFENRDNAYYSHMGAAAEPLVRLAIEEDKRLANQYDKELWQRRVHEDGHLDVPQRWKKNSQIESIVDIVQQNSEALFDHVVENYPPTPEEEDFEDPEDYKSAYKEYERNVEYIDEQARSYLPYAFDDELTEELSKQLASHPFDVRPWMEGSNAWYYLNKQEQKSA